MNAQVGHLISHERMDIIERQEPDGISPIKELEGTSWAWP
jgi:hypothetical protein